MVENKTPVCIHCGKDDTQVPLIVFNYQGQKHYICTEHLPVLIHSPAKLTGKLPDIDKINPVDVG